MTVHQSIKTTLLQRGVARVNARLRDAPQSEHYWRTVELAEHHIDAAMLTPAEQFIDKK